MGKRLGEKVFLDSPHADVREHQKEPARTQKIELVMQRSEMAVQTIVRVWVISYPRQGGKLNG